MSMLMVLAGPSGAGKDAVLNRMKENPMRLPKRPADPVKAE